MYKRQEENDGSQLQDGPVVGQPKHIQPAPDGLQPVGTAAGRVQHAPLLFAPPAPEGGNVWERLRGALSEAETQMLKMCIRDRPQSIRLQRWAGRGLRFVLRHR